MTYYTQTTDQGKIQIGEYVFVQTALNALSTLTEGPLKDRVFLKSGKRQGKVTCEIDKKNHILLTLEVFMIEGENAQEASLMIQNAIYEAIHAITEIRQVKVNVNTLGFVTKK